MTSKMCIVPREVQQGLVWIDIDNCGTYSLSTVLLGIQGPLRNRERNRPGKSVGKPKKKEAGTTPTAPLGEPVEVEDPPPPPPVRRVDIPHRRRDTTRTCVGWSNRTL